MSLVERLKQGRGFTQADQAIADFVLHHPDEVSRLTIGELAAAAHTSNAAVVRLCRKVGVSGYRDLRIELACELERRRGALAGIDADRPFGERESCATMMRSVAELQREALDACYQAMSPVVVDALAHAVAEASHVFLYAIGETCLATEQFASMLTKLGIHCVVAGLRGDYASATSLATEGDLGLFVSYTGKIFGLDFCQGTRDLLAQRGCVTGAVTAADPGSPMLEGIDHVLSFPFRERTEGAIGPFYSAECVRFALNCIYARVYALDFDASDAAKLSVDRLSR
ncbi:MAG: MurR/RpiR family transcriptional regulator [Atopobiaceae bacterium]|nr:MurR/RpiR family transcriptional regulator [Atopobiaceae bacterium]